MVTAKEPKLKPCPFCGSRSVHVASRVLTLACSGAYFVRCMKCGAHGPYRATEKRAENRWNKRAASAAGGTNA